VTPRELPVGGGDDAPAWREGVRFSIEERTEIRLRIVTDLAG